MKEILVDEEGYKQYFELLNDLQRTHTKNAQNGSEAFKDAVGDGWHDNFAFEEAMRTERDIATRINKMLEEQKRLKIIKNFNMDKEIVTINDTIKLHFIYSDNDEEEEIIKLTGKYMPNNSERNKEISLNSPLGQAIFGKKIGSIVNYVVNDKIINVKIICKTNLDVSVKSFGDY